MKPPWNSPLPPPANGSSFNLCQETLSAIRLTVYRLNEILGTSWFPPPPPLWPPLTCGTKPNKWRLLVPTSFQACCGLLLRFRPVSGSDNRFWWKPFFGFPRVYLTEMVGERINLGIIAFSFWVLVFVCVWDVESLWEWSRDWSNGGDVAGLHTNALDTEKLYFQAYILPQVRKVTNFRRYHARPKSFFGLSVIDRN